MASGDTQPTRALIGGLVEELATAMAALSGAAGGATETSTRPSADWVVRAMVSGGHAGHLAIGLVASDASDLAKQVMGFDEAPDDAVVGDMLQEACNQAFAALGRTDVGKGTKFAVEAPVRSGGPDDGDVVAGFQLSLGDGFSPRVVAWGCVTGALEAPAPKPAVAAAAPPSPQPVGAHVAASTPPPPAAHYPNLDVILDIDLPLSVRFGETEMTVDALTKLGPGSVIDLGRSPDDPVDVLVNGRVVAKGEVVVVAGSYGVRITEVVSAADRLRSMNA
jgi:flagellar motor switch protein FliN